MTKTEHFLAIHHGSGPLLLPNAWDRGSAALLTALGFFPPGARTGRDAVRDAFPA